MTHETPRVAQAHRENALPPISRRRSLVDEFRQLGNRHALVGGRRRWRARIHGMTGWVGFYPTFWPRSFQPSLGGVDDAQAEDEERTSSVRPTQGGGRAALGPNQTGARLPETLVARATEGAAGGPRPDAFSGVGDFVRKPRESAVRCGKVPPFGRSAVRIEEHESTPRAPASVHEPAPRFAPEARTVCPQSSPLRGRAASAG